VLSFLVVSLFLLALSFYKDKYFQLYYHLTVQGDGISTPSNGELLGTFRLGRWH
jgi:hypothetical protein